jgi:predicted metal-dependent phosphotriesterase family hydrolase
MNRRKFITLSGIGVAAYTAGGMRADSGYLMTVTGKVPAQGLGTFLPHEHVITDFTGAEKVVQPQYGRDDAFGKMLPHLQQAKANGVKVMAECTPVHIGRDVLLLQRLAKASGIHIITNTGYYAAAGQKYLPRHAYTETATQLAARWLTEWEQGIEGTGIRPGFIKLGIDNAPMNEVQQKLVKAAALTHLKSGLKIAIHNGGAEAVYQQADILKNEGVNADALIWVHAQNNQDGQAHIALAKRGCWISLDGVNAGEAAIKKYTDWVLALKNEGLLHKLLLSHDDGFAVNKTAADIQFDVYKNGNTQPYQSLFTSLKPALLSRGITETEFHQITQQNPAEAFKIEVRS